MKKNFFLQIILFFILFLLYNCKKQEEFMGRDYFVTPTLFNDNEQINFDMNSLPVAYSKLQKLLGNSVVPLYSKTLDITNNGQDEFVFAYKISENENIIFSIFELGNNEIIKTLYNYDTGIQDINTFSMQIHNFFYEDDLCLLLEGKLGDNRNILKVFTISGGTINLLAEFEATYSIFINYEEIESQVSKYFILKDIVLINSALSSTNALIQKKEVFAYNYNENKFENIETTEIVTSEIDNIPSNILYSTLDFYDFVSGFWYPEKYKKMIENNEIDVDDNSHIEYLYLTKEIGELNTYEININYGDYIDQYTVKKMIHLGGVNPGLRLLLNDSTLSNLRYYKYIDITVINPVTIRVRGPEEFQVTIYNKLSKPFIEYVTENNKDRISNEIDEINSKIEKLYTDDNITFEFNGNEFIISDGSTNNSGMYKLLPMDDDYIMFFQFEGKNDFLISNYFLISFDNYDEQLVLTPIKITHESFQIIDQAPYILMPVTS